MSFRNYSAFILNIFIVSNLSFAIVDAQRDTGSKGLGKSSQVDCSNEEVTGVYQDQCEALVDFYSALKGDSWSRNTRWLTSHPVNTWHGIHVVDYNVSIINLQNNKLDGEIPNSIAAFSSLKELMIASNNIKGSLPSALGLLSELETLTLHSNLIKGDLFPSHISESLKYATYQANCLSDLRQDTFLHLLQQDVNFEFYRQKSRITCTRFYGEEAHPIDRNEIRIGEDELDDQNPPSGPVEQTAF